MNAIVHYEYGSPDVLKLEEVEELTPNDDERLIKVHFEFRSSSSKRLRIQANH